MSVIKDNAGWLIILLFLADVVLFIGIFMLFRQLSLMRRSVTILKRGVEGTSLVEKVANQALQIEDLFDLLEEQNRQKDYLADVLAGAMQRVAVVRYDAFEDMGGKLSGISIPLPYVFTGSCPIPVLISITTRGRVPAAWAAASSSSTFATQSTATQMSVCSARAATRRALIGPTT